MVRKWCKLLESAKQYRESGGGAPTTAFYGSTYPTTNHRAYGKGSNNQDKAINSSLEFIDSSLPTLFPDCLKPEHLILQKLVDIVDAGQSVAAIAAQCGGDSEVAKLQVDAPTCRCGVGMDRQFRKEQIERLNYLETYRFRPMAFNSITMDCEAARDAKTTADRATADPLLRVFIFEI